MSTALMGLMLPSQRVKLAKLYREMAAVYRAGFQNVPMLEENARLAEMLAEHWEKGRDELVNDPTPRREP